MVIKLRHIVEELIKVYRFSNIIVKYFDKTFYSHNIFGLCTCPI